LVSCDEASVEKVLGIFRDGGFMDAAVIGRVEPAGSGLRVQS
jgi:hypothetical protein